MDIHKKTQKNIKYVVHYFAIVNDLYHSVYNTTHY